MWINFVVGIKKKEKKLWIFDIYLLKKIINIWYYFHFHTTTYLFACYIDSHAQNRIKNRTRRSSKLLKLSNLKEHSQTWRTVYTDGDCINSQTCFPSSKEHFYVKRCKQITWCCLYSLSSYSEQLERQLLVLCNTSTQLPNLK